MSKGRHVTHRPRPRPLAGPGRPDDGRGAGPPRRGPGGAGADAGHRAAAGRDGRGCRRRPVDRGDARPDAQELRQGVGRGAGRAVVLRQPPVRRGAVGRRPPRPALPRRAPARHRRAPASRWCSTGGPRSPGRSTGPAPATRRACGPPPVRLSAPRRRTDQLRGRAPGPGRGAGHRRPDPHRRDRTPPGRADAGHRRHHPARAGRTGPGRPGRLDLRAGRAGHREDRGRAAPRRVPALSAPGAAAPLRRADRRPEPGVPVVHRGGAARARRGRGRPGHGRGPGRPGARSARSTTRPPPRSSTTRGWRRAAPGAVPARPRARRSRSTSPTARTAGGSPVEAAAPGRRRGAPGGAAVRDRPGAGPGPGGRRCCSGRPRPAGPSPRATPGCAGWAKAGR